VAAPGIDGNAGQGGAIGGDRPRDAVEAEGGVEVLAADARPQGDRAGGRVEGVLRLARCHRVAASDQAADGVLAIGARRRVACMPRPVIGGHRDSGQRYATHRDRSRDAVGVLRGGEVLAGGAGANSNTGTAGVECVFGFGRCDRVGSRDQARDGVGAIGRRGGRMPTAGIHGHAGETGASGGDGARDAVGRQGGREVLARGVRPDGDTQASRTEGVLGLGRRDGVGPRYQARDGVGAIGGRGGRVPTARIHRDSGEPGTADGNGPRHAVGVLRAGEVLARGAGADGHAAIGRAEGVLRLARRHRIGAGGKA